jgi:hypothetical protein
MIDIETEHGWIQNHRLHPVCTSSQLLNSSLRVECFQERSVYDEDKMKGSIYNMGVSLGVCRKLRYEET